MDEHPAKLRVTVAGASGMLGGAFLRLLADRAAVEPWNGRDLHSHDPVEIGQLLSSRGTRFLVNCAADTDVEGAESDPERAYQANAHLPGVLAAACARSGTTLIHFSSTGCYGDWKAEPFTEQDLPEPTTSHHRSKLAGEKLIASSGCRFLTLRTGWLFGGEPGGAKNFVWNRMAEALRKQTLVSDVTQRGCPTFVDDVVEQAWRLMGVDIDGLFNVVAQGSASRYEYVREIVSSAVIACEVQPGPAFRRVAKVSSNEAALNDRLRRLDLDVMPHWRDSVRAYVNVLTESSMWRDLLARRSDFNPSLFGSP